MCFHMNSVIPAQNPDCAAKATSRNNQRQKNNNKGAATSTVPRPKIHVTLHLQSRSSCSVRAHNIKLPIRLSLNSGGFDDDRFATTREGARLRRLIILKPRRGKLVASEQLSSGKWKLWEKPKFVINKHQVGRRLRGAEGVKVNTAYLNMRIHRSSPPQKAKEQRKWLTSLNVTKLRLNEL